MTKEEQQDELCRRLIDGESVRAICASANMPAKSTVFAWLEQDEEFRHRYVRAREMQADALADEILSIADTPVEGEKVTEKADGTSEVVRGDMIEHRRLQVDARKWIASKLFPKKYGEASLLKHADAHGDTLKLDVSERLATVAALMAGAAGSDRRK